MHRHRCMEAALFKGNVRSGLTYLYEPCAFEGTYQLRPA